MMKHLECLDRHITQYEQAIDDQLEQHEITIQEVSDHAQTVAAIIRWPIKSIIYLGQ